MVLVSFTQYSVSFPSLGDPGAVSWSGKTAAKDFTKDGRENPWNATLNKPVPLLIRTLISDWAQEIFLCPIEGQHLSRYFRVRRCLPANSTVRHTRLALLIVLENFRGFFPDPTNRPGGSSRTPVYCWIQSRLAACLYNTDTSFMRLTC